MSAVQQLLMLRPEPGRGPEVIGILREDKRWVESQTAITRAWASRIIHGGAGATGLIGYFLDSEDFQSNGKGLDTARQTWLAGDPSPFVRATQSAGAPFTLEAASMRFEITPNEPGVPEPEPPRIGFTVTLHPTPGPRDRLMEVFAEHQRFIEGIGGHIRFYTGTAAGPGTGDVGYTIYAPTWEALGRIGDGMTSGGPTPLIAALHSDNPPAAVTGSATTGGIDIS